VAGAGLREPDGRHARARVPRRRRGTDDRLKGRLISELTDFVVRHGEILIFLYVLADQLGVPLPAVPALLVVGALAAVGKVNGVLAVVLGVLASLLADLVWYGLGRTQGPRVLRWLCAISLEPDSCVRRTEEVFLRYGVRSLIVAKFVPGLSTVAPPLAGVVGVGLPRFIAYSALAALLWVLTWGGLGYLAGDALERVAARSGRVGTLAAAIAAALVLGYVAIKWAQRRRLLRDLRIARISQESLKRELDAGAPPLIVDLRTELDASADPYVIPGALRIGPEALEARHAEIPRDRDVIVYCS
jgi:membrane protein DedA with SNARE-associated domain